LFVYRTLYVTGKVLNPVITYNTYIFYAMLPILGKILIHYYIYISIFDTLPVAYTHAVVKKSQYLVHVYLCIVTAVINLK
jgi:hypothetical protein